MNTPVVLALAYKKGLLSERKSEIRSVVIHTTGLGPLRRFDREKVRFSYQTPVDAAVRLYSQIMVACPHFVVGQDGQVVQMVPTPYKARHVGTALSTRYHKHLMSAKWAGKEHSWWFRDFPTLVNPLELPGWVHNGKAGWSANESTVGIEVIPPHSDVYGPWSSAALQAVAELVCKFVQPTTLNTVSHSDLHPLARTTPTGVAWDTPPRQTAQWKQFLQDNTDSYVNNMNKESA